MELNVFVAFTGGLVSFFAPCVVPLLPTYVAYIFGVGAKNWDKVLEASIFYLLGFSLIFVALGGLAGGVGGFLRGQDEWLIKIGGLILVIFGLQTLGILHVSLPSLRRLPTLSGVIQNVTMLRSFVLGVVFSLAWTPCIGAILGSILILAASTKTVVWGSSLLFVYSLGISIPFLIISLLITRSRKFVLNVEHLMPIIIKISGAVLVALGLLLLTDTFKYLNAWIFDIWFKLGYQIR